MTIVRRGKKSINVIVGMIIVALLIQSSPLSIITTGQDKTTETVQTFENLYERRNGNTLYVGGVGPNNYSSIQEAVDAASDNDTIIVYSESSPYYEHILLDKSLVLLGEDPLKTVIDGETTGVVVTITASNVILAGFTLQHGDIGVVVTGDSAVVCKNNFLDNKYYAGQCIHSNDSGFYANIVQTNSVYCKGILITDSSLYNRIENNTFDLIYDDHNAIEVYSSSHYTTIRNNMILNSNRMRIDSSNGNLLQHNIFTVYPGMIYCYHSSYNTISENIMNKAYGIVLSNSSCFNMIANNSITGLNGNGRSIDIRNDSNNNIIVHNSICDSLRGIILSCSQFNTISHNDIDGCEDASLYLYWSENNSVHNNTLSNGEIGIEVIGHPSYNERSPYNNLVDNQISENDIGIELTGVSQNTIQQNTFDQNGQGIRVEDGDSITLQNNNFGNNYYYGIRLETSTNMNIIGNTFISNGISITPMNWNDNRNTWTSHTIEDNMVNGKTIYYYVQSDGIIVPSHAAQVIGAECTNISITDIQFSLNDNAVQLAFCSHIGIENISISEMRQSGIFLLHSSHARIENSILQNTKNALFMVYVDNSTIRNNNIFYNSDSGITIKQQSQHNTLFNNTLLSNSNAGIYFDYMVDFNHIINNRIKGSEIGLLLKSYQFNTFVSNRVEDNEYGIYSGDEALPYSCFNRFYHNNFILNNHNYDFAYNYWNNSCPLEGNYWDDYQGSDENGDGIGDSPYIIPGSGSFHNFDYYPLMKPLDYHNNPPNTPSNPHPANGEINVNINPILSWTGGDSDSYDIVTYDVYFGIEPNPPLLQSDHQIPLLQLPELNHSTHYYWKIVARDTSGSTTEGPTWDFTTEREPVTSSLDIELIAGGFGVSASVKNKGDGTATDVDWSITLDGGFILLGEETTGMEESIAAGASAPIKSSLILGFGKTTIVVTATCTESSVTKNATAFVFLFFVLGVK